MLARRLRAKTASARLVFELRMRAIDRTRAWTSIVLVALVTLARAQAPEPRPVVEGPPDADVALEGSPRALERLTAGDVAWNESRREVAFDAWREALLARRSDVGLADTLVAPPPFRLLDPDGTLARRIEDVHHSVRRRLATLGEATGDAWRARFEPLAELELVAAGHSEPRIAWVQREFPLTRAAARAALTLSDLAAERGQARTAARFAERALLDIGRDDDAIRKAVALRSRTRRATTTSRPSGPIGLTLERTISFGPAPDPRDATIPGLAFAIDDEDVSIESSALSVTGLEPPRVVDLGATWHHANGRLLRFDGAGQATAALDVAAALLPLGVEAAAAFSEAGAAWDERFAVRDAHLALVVGRARESRGNALVGVDARAVARIAWARDQDTFVQDGVRNESVPLTGAAALIEFQPGPLLVDDVLVVHFRAWTVGAETATELDEARTESWCAGFDPQSGTWLWSRRLATGTTARAIARGRMEPPEPTSLPALPPVATAGGLVAIDTGLGAIACIDALDGRVAWIVRISRRNTRPSPTGGWLVDDAHLWAVPAAAEGSLLRLGAGSDVGAGLLVAAPLVLEDARIPLALERGSHSTWLAWTAGAGGVAILRQDLASGRESRSAVIPFAILERGSIASAEVDVGWIAAAGGRAWILDHELRVRADVEFGPRRAVPRVSALARRGTSGVGLIRIAGPNSIAFLVSP